MMKFKANDVVLNPDGVRCLVVNVEPWDALQKVRIEPLERPYYSQKEYICAELRLESHRF